MPLTLFEFIKKQLKIDGSDDDDVIALLIDGAKEHLKEAGVLEPTTEDEMSALYKQAIYIQTLLNYQNYESSLNVEALNRALTAIILKIRW